MNSIDRIVVAVDGPAGSGKSSICRHVAEKMGWVYVSTGILYRAVGLLAMRRDASLEDESVLAATIDQIANGYSWDGSVSSFCVDGENLSSRLGDGDVARAASKVAKIPLVRKALLPLQRSIVMAIDTKGILVDGRDIGTVVFPDATLKIYMDASLGERANRRMKEYQEKFPGMTLEEVMEDISKRDKQDSERETAPMMKADDALILDTTGCNLEEGVVSMLNLLEQNL